MLSLIPMSVNDLPLFEKWLYTPHVAKWYHDPLDWMEEVRQKEGTYHWIHHYLVKCDDRPVGFCQYYACADSDEDWSGYTLLGGSYSIDYMIGEADCLGKGYGKTIVQELISKIRTHNDAKRIVVQPEPENSASRGLLLFCGFVLDGEKDIFVLTL